MLSYVLRKIQSDILGVGGATIFEVKSVTIIPSLPYGSGKFAIFGQNLTSVEKIM